VPREAQDPGPHLLERAQPEPQLHAPVREIAALLAPVPAAIDGLRGDVGGEADADLTDFSPCMSRKLEARYRNGSSPGCWASTTAP
jgi:hypothetical protein